jgi:hypothetical protein
VRTSRAISGADIPVDDANRIIARRRLDWYFARREIDLSLLPSSGVSSRTNTSGGRIATSLVGDMRPGSPPKPSFRSNVSGRPTSSGRPGELGTRHPGPSKILTDGARIIRARA